MRDNEKIPAGFGARAAAYAVDRALLLAALGTVRLPALVSSLLGGGQLTAGSFLFRYSFLDVLCYVLSAVYFVLLTYFTGSTLGKKLMHIRVEDADGGELRFIDVLYRETVGRFLSRIMLAGYIMALVDRRRRAFHDWLCQTRVVYDLGHGAEEPAVPAPAEAVPVTAAATHRTTLPTPAHGPGPVQAPPLRQTPDAGYTVPGETPRGDVAQRED